MVALFPGDIPVPEWTPEAIESLGQSIVAQTELQTNGPFRFENVNPGAYIVGVVAISASLPMDSSSIAQGRASPWQTSRPSRAPQPTRPWRLHSRAGFHLAKDEGDPFTDQTRITVAPIRFQTSTKRQCPRKGEARRGLALPKYAYMETNWRKLPIAQRPVYFTGTTGDSVRGTIGPLDSQGTCCLPLPDTSEIPHVHP